ncbi:MmyB family transcriptional regulator [Nonomuraea muscovyensis]
MHTGAGSARRTPPAGLTGLVGELTVRSPEFAGLWAAHSVGDCATDSAGRVHRRPVWAAR